MVLFWNKIKLFPPIKSSLLSSFGFFSLLLFYGTLLSIILLFFVFFVVGQREASLALLPSIVRQLIPSRVAHATIFFLKVALVLSRQRHLLFELNRGLVHSIRLATRSYMDPVSIIRVIAYKGRVIFLLGHARLILKPGRHTERLQLRLAVICLILGITSGLSSLLLLHELADSGVFDTGLDCIRGRTTPTSSFLNETQAMRVGVTRAHLIANKVGVVSHCEDLFVVGETA